MTTPRALLPLAFAVLAAAGGGGVRPAEAAHRKLCRFCGPPWFYPEPSIEPPALPHGFVATIPVGEAAPVPNLPARLERYSDIPEALGACWHPAADFAGAPWHSVTLRVAFKRDGSVFGMPRIPFAEAQTAPARADLVRSLRDALERCTPLSLSPGLGAAVAGEIFAIRFTLQERS